MLQISGSINRLKKFFRSGINYADYSGMLDKTSRKISGNLPKDIIKEIIKYNSDNKKQAILDIQRAFEIAAEKLKAVNKAEKQAIFRLPHNDGSIQNKVEELLETGDITDLWKRDPLYVNAELNAVIEAEEQLLNGLRQYIPDVKNVIITPLESGQFSIGYKCEFINREGKKLISDKALKVYREQPLIEVIAEKNQKFIESASDETLLNLEKKKDAEMIANFGFSLGRKSVSEIKKAAQDTVNFWKNFFKDMEVKHGAMAEANITEYIRYFTGHKIMPEKGLSIPSMFGLGNTKFCLSEYIGKTTQAKEKFNFLRLGLNHADFDKETGKNCINGICFDVGGIMTVLKSLKLSGDKSVIRFIKSLFRCKPEERGYLIKEFELKYDKKIFPDEFIKQITEK